MLLSLRPESRKKTSTTSTAYGQSGSPTTENESVWGGASVLENLRQGLGIPPRIPWNAEVKGHTVKAKTSLASCIPSPGTSTLVGDEGPPRRSKVKPANRYCRLQWPTTTAQGGVW